MNEVVIKVIGNYSYQTTRCLGEGVYGKVYEGTEKQTKQKVAIKKIDLATFTNDKYLQNAIFSQIYLLKRFNHPNIVKFKDVLSSKNSLYIITEFCKNGDLKQVLKKKKFKEEQAFQVLKQILSGFSQLVRERIVHRDLKPANILISDGIYKIGDFGFAKYVDNFGSQMLKSCVGSPIYMAPQILQRTPYTTKCDIWSIGVIFYQMIHNTPPWKAKDQNQLLRGIKNVSISHILRKSALSAKAMQFLKRTLAYSEQQRIGWAELFQNYGPRSQKHNQSTQKHKNSTKQKQRVISANSSSNLSTQYGSQNGKILPLTPISSTSSSIGHLNSPTISPQRKRSLFPPSSQNHSNSNPRSQSTQHKKPNQIENVVRWRQFLLFYHYYCVESFTNFYQFSTYIPTKQECFARMLVSLSLLVKNRSTFCLSMIAIHSRTIKSAEQLYKTMKLEHESYEMVYNDIVMSTQKLNIYKILKSEITTVIGHGQVINEERMEKIQNYMIESAIQNVRSLVQSIKSKQRERRNMSTNITNRITSGIKQNGQILQIIDNLLEILQFSINRQKYNKNAQQILQELNNENYNNANGSTPQIKYDINTDAMNLNLPLNSNTNLSLNKQRKSSEEFKQKESIREAKEWGESIARDSFGLAVIQKYERIVALLNVESTNSGGSCGNIKY